MSDFQEEIAGLVEFANLLEHGSTKIDLLEQAVSLADAHNDVELGYETREELITASQFGGRPEVSLAAFSWCLSQTEREPERFSEADLLWKMKWIVNSLPRFPEIDKPTILDMLEDMKVRFERNGAGAHAVYHKTYQVRLKMGDRDEAELAYSKYQKTNRDYLSDCAACVADVEVDYLLDIGKDELALEKVQPILQGRLSCAEVPHSTYAHVLFPLLKTDRVEEAIRHHRKGYPMVQRNAAFLGSWGKHIAFLGLTGNFGKAVRLIERHLRDGLRATDPWAQMEFYRNVTLALDMLGARSRSQIKLRVPKEFPLEPEGDSYSVESLAGWFRGEVKALAGRFDERNGNGYASGLIAEWEERKKVYTPYPLRGRGQTGQ